MIKAGVDLRGLVPQMAVAFAVAQACYARHDKPCVITSASDGVHGPNSLHYQGKALDLRTRHLTEAQTASVYRDLKYELGEQFDVVLEDDHLHVEFDPKEPASEAV